MVAWEGMGWGKGGVTRNLTCTERWDQRRVLPGKR